MTRLELLQLVTARARANGFDFRRWYTGRLGLPWISAEAAVTLLDAQRRYYALLFSHEFASAFWKPGSDITFEVPGGSYKRTMPDGTLRTVQRKPFLRRSARPDAWRYHLQQMALAEDPLRHLRKYMHIEENLDLETTSKAGAPAGATSSSRRSRGVVVSPDSLSPTPDTSTTKKRAAPKKMPAQPMLNDPPAFLKRPYKGALPG